MSDKKGIAKWRRTGREQFQCLMCKSFFTDSPHEEGYPENYKFAQYCPYCGIKWTGEIKRNPKKWEQEDKGPLTNREALFRLMYRSNKNKRSEYPKWIVEETFNFVGESARHFLRHLDDGLKTLYGTLDGSCHHDRFLINQELIELYTLFLVMSLFQFANLFLSCIFSFVSIWSPIKNYDKRSFFSLRDFLFYISHLYSATTFLYQSF